MSVTLVCRLHNETCYGGLARGPASWWLQCFRYADTTTLIATSVADMAELLIMKRVKVESESLGLCLNVSKTN